MSDIKKMVKVTQEVKALIEPLSVAEIGVVVMEVLSFQAAKAGIPYPTMVAALAEVVREQQD